MSTTTPLSASTPTLDSRVEGDQRVELVGIGWDVYRALLKAQGERARPQMIYLDRNLTLVSPSNLHECLKKRLGQIVVEVATGLNIPLVMIGETTLRRKRKDAGVQPDEAYYLANAGRVADKVRTRNIDLQIDPPPDLAIEVVHTHDATAAIRVLRRLRVPEVWVGDEERLRILIRQPNGRYLESQTSLAFPFLTGDEVFDWANRLPTGFDSDWIREVRQWVQDVLVPRVQAQDGRGG